MLTIIAHVNLIKSLKFINTVYVYVCKWFIFVLMFVVDVVVVGQPFIISVNELLAKTIIALRKEKRNRFELLTCISDIITVYHFINYVFLVFRILCLVVL